jgi:hypothetical protein
MDLARAHDVGAKESIDERGLANAGGTEQHAGLVRLKHVLDRFDALAADAAAHDDRHLQGRLFYLIDEVGLREHHQRP